MLKQEQKLIWRGRIYRYVPFIFCVILISFLSTREGSMARTSLFLRPILEFLFPGAEEATLNLYHGYIRKFAHLVEYALLSLTAARAFRSSSKWFLRSHWAFSAILAVLTIAAMDETYQSFNPLRTGTIYDVMIDLAGGMLGLLIFLVFRASSRRKGTNARSDHF